MSEDEAASISKHLGISLTRFYQSYTKRYNKVDGWRLLKDVGEVRQQQQVAQLYVESGPYRPWVLLAVRVFAHRAF